ncbi:MAG TPA: hypothetical protein VIL33_07715, partial [Rhodothermia bacterium]
ETSPSEDAPAIASVLGFFGSAIWNIVTIRNSVSEYNRKVRQRVQLTPVVDGAGSTTLRLAVQF